MQRHTLYIIVIIWGTCFLWSCSHTPKKQGGLILKEIKTEERVGYLREQLKKKPDDVEMRVELGKIFLSEDMVEEAIVQLERAVSIDSKNIEGLLLLSLALQKLREPKLKNAAMLLEKASKIEPNNADVHLNLGQVYEKQGWEESAISEFNRAVELSNDPATLISAHLGLMAIYKKRGQSEKANKEYEAAYKIYTGVEELIKEVEIDSITPPPEYAGEEFMDGDPLHPLLEERIRRAREEILKISREEK